MKFCQLWANLESLCSSTPVVSSSAWITASSPSAASFLRRSRAGGRYTRPPSVSPSSSSLIVVAAEMALFTAVVLLMFSAALPRVSVAPLVLALMFPVNSDAFLNPSCFEMSSTDSLILSEKPDI